MATMSASQMAYDYGPGPSWGPTSQMPGRGPPASYTMYKHPYAEATPYEDAYDSDSVAAPDVRVIAPSRGEQRDPDPEFEDDRSVYSERMSAPQNFYSSVFKSGSASSHHLSAVSARSDVSRDSWAKEGSARPDSNVDPFSFMKYESPRQQLPKVVVSSPSNGSVRTQSRYEDEAETEAVIPHPITPPPFQPPQGRVPSAVQGARNFSRPNRGAVSSAMSPDMTAQSSPRPALPGDEERKREVLERNRHRQGQSPHSQPTSPSGSSISPNSPYSNSYSSHHDNGSGISQDNGIGTGYASSSSSQPQSTMPARPPRPAPPPSLLQSVSAPPSAGVTSPQLRQGQGLVLPSHPLAVRSSTTESIYSMYSYYQLDSNSAAPSPSETHFDQSKPETDRQDAPKSTPQTTTSPSKNSKSPTSSPNPKEPAENPTTADDFLALGIAHHEADRLTESAACFEKSATLNDGCAVGMLMWGLTLRHGWGVPKDEPRAFKWLKRAAEHAVVDLQQGKNNAGRDAVKKELVLAVYEVGQCFFQGWGVPRDKEMGVSYFQTAAQLGDPDAQQDLAFCLANGKGCKKDKKAAAKWYRAAAAQGASTVGLAWIYKPKYAD